MAVMTAETATTNTTSFFSQGYSFTQSIKSLHLNNAEDSRFDGNIAIALRRYADSSLVELFKLSETDPIIHHYCNSNKTSFTKIWEDKLEELELQPVATVHPFKSLKGFYWYSQAKAIHENPENYDNALPEVFFNYLNLAINCGDYFAGCLLLQTLADADSVADNIAEIEESFQQLALLHSTPGYLLLAKAYFHAARDTDCLDAIEKATLLIDNSTNEIANSQLTKEQIEALLTELRLSIEQRDSVSLASLANGA